MSSIIIFQKILAHYRVDQFKKIIDKEKDIKIVYGQDLKNGSVLSKKNSGINFYFKKNIYFPLMNKFYISLGLLNVIKEKPSVVITEGSVGNLNILILIFLREILKFRLILWTFGYRPDKGFNPTKSYNDKFRLLLYKKADRIIFYWETGKNMVAKYINDKSKLFVANNTIDTDKEFLILHTIEQNNVERIKKELNLKMKYNFIYVGRIIKDKDIDIAIKAFKLVQEQFNNVQFTIVGNGPELEKLKKFANKIKHITFLGAIYDKEKIGNLLYVSDAVINPGRLGNSVIHAFCYKTPVISQFKNYPYHGEGSEYLIDNYNGLWTKDNDISDFAEKMIFIIENNDAKYRMSKNAFKTAKKYSIENFVDKFIDAIAFKEI